MFSLHNSFTKAFPANVVISYCILQKHFQPMFSLHNSITKAFPAKAFVTSFLQQVT